MNSLPYRIVFMGTPQFAVPTLKALLDHGEEVVAVVTQPDRPKGRGRKLTPPPVKEVALAASIPVLQPKSIKTDAFLAEINDFRPDLTVVVAFGRLLPKSLIELPPQGTINVHASLLPKYRGAAPIQWSLIHNEAETGVTIMQMDEGLDTGDILLPGAIPIAPDDTAATLSDKLSELGGRLLVEAIERLKTGNLPATKQDDHESTLAPLLCKQEGIITWQKSAAEISGLIRGLDPWPTASTSLEGKQLRLFSPRVVPSEVDKAPGTVCRADGEGLLIATGQDYLLVAEVQLEGSKRMSVDAFLRGRPLSPGQRLGGVMGAWFSGNRKWLALLLLACTLAGALSFLLHGHGLLYQLLFHLKELMADSSRLREQILAYGPLAPLVYIGLQVLQVILAPIPGEASGLLGGYLFGGWAAFVYSSVGLTIGSLIAFGIARLLGDTVRRRLQNSRVYHRFNRLVYKNTFVIPFVLFLFPGFPKDTLSYILGLSVMPWQAFLFIAAVGRMPGTLLLSFQGAQVYEKDYWSLALLLLVSLAVSLPCYLYRRQILIWLSQLGHHHGDHPNPDPTQVEEDHDG